MYSKKYVAILIIALLGIFFSPLIYNTSAPGLDKEAPTFKNGKLQEPKGDHCIENATWMKAHHMELLKEMRHDAIRNMNRTYVSKDYGTEYNASIEECYKCHTSYKDSCGTCHEYSGVKPYCFECHNKPETINEKGVPKSTKYWQVSSQGFQGINKT